MVMVRCPGAGDGWHGGPAWRYVGNWLRRSSNDIDRAVGQAKDFDEFVALTGYHRKHAIRVLRQRETGPPCARQYIAQYGPEVREALVALWEVSDRLCSKRLKPLIPICCQHLNVTAGSI